MKITSAKVIVCSPDRNFVTLKIETDQGLHGIGDATVNGREKAVVAYLEEHVIPTLIGRDAAQIEDTWQYLYRGAYWRRGPITMAAISAVDLALWDIKGKAADMPLYQLLGGASRNNVMIYSHAQGLTIDEAVDAVAAKKEQGFVAIRAQVGVPGLPPIYGVGGRSNQGNGRHGASAAARRDLVDLKISGPHPKTVRQTARHVRRRSASPARRASSPHADRGGAAGQGSWSRFVCSGSRIPFPRSCRKVIV